VLTSHDPFYLRLLERLSLWKRPVLWLPAGSNIPVDGQRDDPRRGRPTRTGRDQEAIRLAYFGQLDSTRGIEDLFAALARLREGGDFRLLMIGSAGRPERYRDSDGQAWTEFRRLRSLPASLGIEDAVEWTEYLPAEDVAARLRAVDLCVLPYRRNSIGRSALVSALEQGVPVVLAGTPEGVAPLEPGRDVLLVPPGRPEELADAVGRLADDAEERGRLAAGGLKAARIFAWPRIAAAAVQAYRRAIA
jgi:glycosyltransferase involved in cell wall biosynthesis